MCYHCLEHSWLKVATAVLEQQHNSTPTTALSDDFECLASALSSSSEWDREHYHGHSNPLTFSTAVVAKQMVATIAQSNTNLRLYQEWRANQAPRLLQTVLLGSHDANSPLHHLRANLSLLQMIWSEVERQVSRSWAGLSPEHMLRFLRQALRRMNTVRDPNPYGRAVTGVAVMPAALRQLNAMLLPDDGQLALGC